MRPILMVAYHFPPEGNSSGVLRTLKFTKYLPDHGWQPHVLTLRERLYPVQDATLLREIGRDVVVHRTAAFDATRHLAIRGRFLGFLSVPDRWASWLPFGLARGVRVAHRANIRALFSTSPHATAHLIAGSLATTLRLPWVADFRDPWIEDGLYPRPGTVRHRVESVLEAFVIHRATRITVTTEEFRRDLLRRYPGLSSERVLALYNGYDEPDFRHLRPPARPPQFEILHTGLVTPEYRDPFPLLRAVKRCVERGDLDPGHTRLTFLGGGDYLSSPAFRAGVTALGLGPIVDIADRLPYGAGLQRMTEAAVLLLLQASDDTRALIPAKAFEYLRVGRPVLALTLRGATADLIDQAAAGVVVDPREEGQLDQALASLYDAWRAAASPPRAPSPMVRRFDRSALTGELARVLEEITSPRPPLPRSTPAITTLIRSEQS
jgi:glycosyltransferase involved in cell wall biosynthesis